MLKRSGTRTGQTRCFINIYNIILLIILKDIPTLIILNEFKCNLFKASLHYTDWSHDFIHSCNRPSFFNAKD